MTANTGRVKGVRALQARLAAIRESTPALVDRVSLGNFLLVRMRKRFIAEKDPNLVGWQKLSPRTSNEGRRGKLRLKEEHLYKSLDVLEGRGFGVSTGAGFRIGVKPNIYTITFKRSGRSKEQNPAEYGRFHQLGIGVPRRQFLGIGPTDVKAVSDRIRRQLRKNVGGV